jgi:phosphoglycerate dehydrogenase-like enzyme
MLHVLVYLCRISMMKEGAFLLNVSRGGLVNSDELIAGLERGQIGGIGLDVWENEGELCNPCCEHMLVLQCLCMLRRGVWENEGKTGSMCCSD